MLGGGHENDHYARQEDAHASQAASSDGFSRSGRLQCEQVRAHRVEHIGGGVWAKLVVALKRHGVELPPETDEHGAVGAMLERHISAPRSAM